MNYMKTPTAIPDNTFTQPRDYAMGPTVESDYVKVVTRPCAHADAEPTNTQTNFEAGLVLRQPL